MPQKNDRILGLKRRHIAQMAQIEQLCFSQPWSEETLEMELDNPLAIYFVCEDETGLKGYIGTRVIHDECYITNVAVHPGWRRQGVARRLLRELEQWLLAKNVSMMTLEVRESNAPAREFYESEGFVPMGRRRNYYELPSEDAILMTKMLEAIDVSLD